MPALVTGFIVLLIAIHWGRDWLAETTDLKLVVDAGFIPARWSILLGWADPEEVIRHAGAGDGDLGAARSFLAQYVAAGGPAPVPSFFTYAFLHGSWMHVILNCVWLASFGTAVARRCGPARSVLLAAATALGGALAYWMADPLSSQVVIGASGIVSGFMGAAVTFMFEPGGSMLAPRARSRTPLVGGGGLLRNRNALLFLGVWFAINLVMGLTAAPLGIAEGGIAWQAHIGGLVTGLLLFPLLDPARRRPLALP